MTIDIISMTIEIVEYCVVNSRTLRYWKYIQYIIKEMLRQPGTNGQKPPTEAGFAGPTSGTTGCGKTEMKMERP
jgi:hypothetical protein